MKVLICILACILSSCSLWSSRDPIVQTGSIDIYTWEALSWDVSILDATGSIASGVITHTGVISTTLISQTGATSMTKNLVCIQEVCIDKNYPYFVDGESLVQISWTQVESTVVEYLSKNPGKDENSAYIMPYESGNIRVVSVSRKTAMQKKQEILGGSQTTLSYPTPDLFVKITENQGCVTSYKEEFFDTHGNTIRDPSNLLPTYPKSIKIGNLVLKSDWKWAHESKIFGLKFTGNETPKKLGIFSLKDNLESKILPMLLSDSGFGTYAQYVIEFREIPGVLFFYSNSLGSSEAVINTPITPSMLDQDGNLLDMVKTLEILKLYRGDGTDRKIFRDIRKTANTDDYLGITASGFTRDMLPIFSLRSLGNDGYYLLFPAKWYEGFTSAELCKPLVYIYDREHRSNSLTVRFPRGGDFTRVIPSFTDGDRWDFWADAHGNISVSNTENIFPYLYYSAKVPDYTYNRYGWEVYGRDIESFFEQKLDTIGFNAQEKKDFIQYWIHEFDPDIAYFVSFKFDDALDAYVTLDFASKPRAQMRVLLEAHPIEFVEKRYLWPHIGTKIDSYILKSFIRSGEYDVFEWGGTVQKQAKGPIHIH